MARVDRPDASGNVATSNARADASSTLDAATTTVAVVGLGYVGLPLAVEFGKRYPTIGFDLSADKIARYRRHVDPTGEVSRDDLAPPTTSTWQRSGRARAADFIIVAVPTPVDIAHQPDLAPLVGASESVGRNMKRGATVVYESTVYPGATEEVCMPILEKHSGMRWKRDFFVGYSPERINPGDKERTLTKITKVVSGDTPRRWRRSPRSTRAWSPRACTGRRRSRSPKPRR